MASLLYSGAGLVPKLGFLLSEMSVGPGRAHSRADRPGTHMAATGRAGRPPVSPQPLLPAPVELALPGEVPEPPLADPGLPDCGLCPGVWRTRCMCPLQTPEAADRVPAFSGTVTMRGSRAPSRCCGWRAPDISRIALPPTPHPAGRSLLLGWSHQAAR